MITIGVDCGVTGAIAFLTERGEYLHVADLPICVYGATKWIDPNGLIEIIDKARIMAGNSDVPARAVVEQTHAMPSFGKKCPACKKAGSPTLAATSKGLTLGSTVAALQVARVSTELVAAQKWKRDMGLLMPGATDKQKKDASLTKARMFFPSAPLERQKDNNRAEALLIARWYATTRARAAAA